MGSRTSELTALLSFLCCVIRSIPLSSASTCAGAARVVGVDVMRCMQSHCFPQGDPVDQASEEGEQERAMERGSFILWGRERKRGRK